MHKFWRKKNKESVLVLSVSFSENIYKPILYEQTHCCEILPFSLPIQNYPKMLETALAKLKNSKIFQSEHIVGSNTPPPPISYTLFLQSWVCPSWYDGNLLQFSVELIDSRKFYWKVLLKILNIEMHVKPRQLKH